MEDYPQSSTPAPKEFWIPGEVYSSKNSKAIFRNKTSGKPFITDNANVKGYKKNTIWLYKEKRVDFQDVASLRKFPLRVEFEFHRKTHRLFDFANMVQVVQDQMVAAGWIPDDSMDFLLPLPCPYKVSKDNPGVLIRLL